MDEIIQLKITLAHTKPPIWRRILVDRNATFLELHYIIQIAMGWSNSHLFEFQFGDYRVGEVDHEFDDFGMGELLEASETTLDQMITGITSKFIYEYDFGDSWIHKIVVEKYLPRDKSAEYPLCIAGKLNCPPEDCGGIPGFYNLLEIIADKKHPERKETLQWLGGSYDPAHFDKDAVNKILKTLAGNWNLNE